MDSNVSGADLRSMLVSALFNGKDQFAGARTALTELVADGEASDYAAEVARDLLDVLETAFEDHNIGKDTLQAAEVTSLIMQLGGSLNRYIADATPAPAAAGDTDSEDPPFKSLVDDDEDLEDFSGGCGCGSIP